MTAYLGEFLGTMLLVLLGDGVCANVNLNKIKFQKWRSGNCNNRMGYGSTSSGSMFQRYLRRIL